MKPTLDAIFYSDRWRSAQWTVIAAVLLYIALGLNLQESAPALQAQIYYVGTVCLRVTLGYWAARTVLGRLDHAQFGRSSDTQYMARAIIVAAVLLTSK
jgi:hypothetical protein